MTIDDVKDIVRNTAKCLRIDPRGAWFLSDARNDRSIQHNYSVFAQIERDLIPARQAGDLADHAKVPTEARAGID